MDSERLAEVAASKVGAALLEAATNVARAHAGRPIEHVTTVATVLRPDGTGRVAVLPGDIVDDLEVLLELTRRAWDYMEVDGPTSAELAVINRLRAACGHGPVAPGHGEPRRVGEGLEHLDTQTGAFIGPNGEVGHAVPAPASPDASHVDDDERVLLDEAMDDRAV